MNFFRKTNAERKALWVKKNPLIAKEVRKKYDKKYYESKKNELSDTEKDLLRIKHAEAQKRYYAKKKINKTSFESPQTRGKVIKKTRALLTNSQEQSTEVLSTLLTEIGKVANCKRVNRRLPVTKTNAERDYYNHDDISRQSPNLKDNKTILMNNNRHKLSIKNYFSPYNTI